MLESVLSVIVKIQITELSYAGGDESVVVTNQNLNMRQDGSYSNSKLFAGTYRMLPLEGAFYPYDAEGETVELRNGKMTECNFTVTPYLELEWVDEPLSLIHISEPTRPY